jgi:hypothetical protein
VQILLLLSAMLASLTGLISGDGAVEPHHVQQAVAAAASIVEAAPAARQAEVATPAPAAFKPRRARLFAPAAARPFIDRAPVNERRLE